jgi:KDO2-lipid IV(A) lauroyltransferase
VYYLLFASCFLISLLPLRVLYLLSDGIYLVLYYGVGYRKKVVTANLLQAFPEKSAHERATLAKKFYRGLTDTMVETIKLITLSPRALNKRFTADLRLLHALETSGKSIQIHLGHYFNWEWANLYFKLQTRQPFLVTYMPMSNKAADRLFRYLRARFGSVMIPATDVLRTMHPWQGKPYISVLVADQNPGKVRRAYWYPFMNKMTAFYKGPELSARRGDLVVVFGEIQKVKRGHYHIVLKLASEHPALEPEGAVTRAFVEFLEKGIRAQPENWVWSHRRWKHTWKGGEEKEGVQEI